jgi:hypothetical protein
MRAVFDQSTLSCGGNHIEGVRFSDCFAFRSGRKAKRDAHDTVRQANVRRGNRMDGLFRAKAIKPD